MRCRAQDLAAGRGDAQYCETTVIGPFRTKPKNAIDAREPGRIREHLLAEALRALRFHERRDQRHSAISQRGGSHGILSVTGAIAAGEVTKAGGFRCGIPAAIERRCRKNEWIMPEPSAELLDAIHI